MLRSTSSDKLKASAKHQKNKKMWKLCVIYLVICHRGISFSQSGIRMPPSITRGPPKQNIFRSDESVTLDCKGKGVPGVVYEWKKNGEELNLNLPNIEVGVDGSITINNAASSDEGYYQCFARNQYGTALSNTSHLQRAYLDYASGIPGILQKTVKEGIPFHIEATTRGSFPKSIYGWVSVVDTVDINEKLIRLSRRMQIAENGDLHFAYAKPEDALSGRLYKFNTFNKHMDIVVGGGYTQLTVTGNAEDISQFAPTLGFSSETQTVALIGGSVKLRCFFYGNPEPAISWTGPRNTLPIGRYVLNSSNTELIIYNVMTTDEGDYICTGTNRPTQGRTQHNLEIRVEAVPRFLTVNDGPYDVNVTEGESFTFNCNADAKPTATIAWFQDGKPLDSINPPRRFEFSNNNRSLTIRNVCRDCVDRESGTDLMVIQCNASNVHGYALAQGYLNVLSKTVVTIYNASEVTVNTNEEGRVEFDCRATSDTSTPPTFKWFKVEGEGDRLLYNEPPFLTINAGLLSIRVAANTTEKWPTYLGQYRCVVDTGHTRVNQTVSITSLFVDVVEPTSPTCTEKDYTWIWICIGVGGSINILVCVFCEVSRRKRNKRAGRNNIVKLSSRESGTEAADPFNH